MADKAEEQPIACMGDIDIRWLHRNGAAAGTTTLLQDAVRVAALPGDMSSLFAWVACEFEAFRAIPIDLRKEWNLKKGQTLIVAYWRKGEADDSSDKMETHSD